MSTVYRIRGNKSCTLAQLTKIVERAGMKISLYVDDHTTAEKQTYAIDCEGTREETQQALLTLLGQEEAGDNSGRLFAYMGHTTRSGVQYKTFEAFSELNNNYHHIIDVLESSGYDVVSEHDERFW